MVVALVLNVVGGIGSEGWREQQDEAEVSILYLLTRWLSLLVASSTIRTLELVAIGTGTAVVVDDSLGALSLTTSLTLSTSRCQEDCSGVAGGVATAPAFLRLLYLLLSLLLCLLLRTTIVACPSRSQHSRKYCE